MVNFDQGGFHYPPLSRRPNEIRILELYPGGWNEDIRCQLKVASLDERPLFHALSYSWGHHNERSAISVNCKTFRISPSLESALRHVRQEDETLSMWVDKLCINQADEEEKAQQIGLMHRIYRECSNVLIWLGPAEPPVRAAEKHELLRRYSTGSTLSDTPLATVEVVLATLAQCFSCFGRRHAYQLVEQEDDYLDDPFDIVMHFAADRHISELPCFFRSRFGKRLYFKETRRFRAMWIRFKQLLETSWHSRFWCVQEALLPNSAWIMYGRWRIPLSAVNKSLQNQRRHLHTCCSAVEKLFPTTYAFCPDSLFFASAPTNDLDVLLRTYRYKDCRNPRDKVYGILALHDGAAAIKVDYTQSTAQVYTDAMSLIIDQAHGDLRCLTGSGFGSPHHDLPSWVRDLYQRPDIAAVQFEMRRLQAYSLYNASDCLPGPSLVRADDHLSVSGRHLDTIKTVCLPFSVPVEHIDWRYVLSVLRSWHRATRSSSPSSSLSPFSSLLRPDVHRDPFWRCILVDTLWSPAGDSYRRFTDSDIDPYESWLRRAVLDCCTFRAPEVRDEYVQALLAATWGRALFVTEEGGMGLCGPGARSGDEVWVLKGGRVPFVLRRREDGRGHGLVTDCSLHGFMDGEGAMATEVEHEIVTLR